MPSPPRIVTAIFTTTVAFLMLVLSATAGAATSKYPPSSAARGFVGGAAGWTSSSSNEGTCLPPVLCASVTNSYEGSGGTDGGFIRSAYLGVAGATAVGGATSGTWESPSFTYDGAGGKAADAVSFSLDRRSNVDQFLGLAGNSADYTVRLLDLSEGGEATTLVAPTTLAGANSWTSVSRGPIDPRRLTAGHGYRIQITSTYTTGTAVAASGNADYDNVVLTASSGGGGKGGGGGKANKGNGKGAGGSGALTERRLLELLRQATPGTAVVSDSGKRLFVRVNCPGKIGHACRTTAQGLLRKHRPATLKQTVRLRRGKSKLVALRVKPVARKKLAARKRLLVRQKVHAGKTVATAYKSRRLVRR
jgi:hypothetical protein